MSDLVRLDMDDGSGHGAARRGVSDPPVDDLFVPSTSPGSMGFWADGYTVPAGEGVGMSAASTRPSLLRRDLPWIVALALVAALTIAVWPSSVLLGHHDDPVVAMAVGELEGRPVAVSAGSGYDDTALRVWDLTTGDPVGEPIVAHPVGVLTLALGEVDGRPVAVIGGYDDAVRVLDLTTRELVGEPMRLSKSDRVDAVAVGEVNGRAVVVVAGDWGDAATRKLPVRVWDLATHEPVGEPLVGHTGLVLSVALGEVNGRAVAVTGSVDGTTRIWDLVTRKQMGDPIVSATGVGNVALGQVDGRQVVVSTDDENISVWDLATRRLIGAPIPTGLTYGVRTVVIEEVDGRSVILAGGGDGDDGGAVQVWDLGTHEPLGRRMRYANWVGNVAIGHVAGRVVAVTGDGDGEVRMRDLSGHTQ
ncbi:WD40 repeat domain-containing protein [Nonomuraea sp. NPDC049646]|uniref:WD40 repeat domain-containing protein n=1 Tax=unclassified Nonomuraea TaxID=2593643 RepID=UPI0037B7F32D